METLRSLYHTARRAAPQAGLGLTRNSTGRLDFSPLVFFFEAERISRPPASDALSAGIAQRLWRHSNTVNSFSRPALNSTITAAAQADVPAEIEHSMSDKMQGSPVTAGIRGNAALLNRLFYTTLI